MTMQAGPTIRLVLAALISAVMATDAQCQEEAAPAASNALQALVDKAKPGDVIRLAPGIHDGPLVLRSPITLQGAPGTTIRGSGKGSVITVTAPDVTVSGLHVTGSGSSHETLDSGIKLTKTASRARVLNNSLEGNLVGIDVHGAKDALVRGNIVVGRQDHRMNSRGNGIYVWNAPGTVIENNKVRYGRDGIFINTSRDNIFRNNSFRDLRFAVHYMYAHNSEVSDNFSENNHIGYALMYSKNLVVINNVSRGDRDQGLMLNYANSSKIRGNYVYGAEKCLFIYNANKNILARNRFENCLIGIHFTAGSERNQLNENAFIGNRTQVKYVGSRWLDWGASGRGNFWSDHAAFDINGDGLADMPYRPNDLMDHILWAQPATRLLLGSPAVQLIRWTQSKFPALLPGGVIDTKPLLHAVKRKEIHDKREP